MSATAVITEYYSAMNQHCLDQVLSYLHQDVLVTFPEEERNWQGVEVAREKFSGMFQRMPSFTGRFEVLSEDTVVHDDQSDDWNEYIIKVACHFTCKVTESDSSRNMVYHIRQKLIEKIHHL